MWTATLDRMAIPDTALEPSALVNPAARPTINELRVRAAAHTHIGKVRKTNEDQFFIGEVTSAIQVTEATLCPNRLYLGPAPLTLLIVADGMGGHAAGERASALAISSVEGFILRALGHVGTLGIQGAPDLLRASFQVADGTVIEASQASASLSGMGTTMTVALAGGSEVHIAHAGDSRAYLFRDRTLSQLTRDHTVAEALKERGAPANRAHEALRHMVTNAVGGGTPGVIPDLTRADLKVGDQLLLCTDGLTNMVDDNKMAAILAKCNDPNTASRQLIEAALAGGGEDNVTALVANFDPS